jgi:FkbM family methyltransferase
VTIQHRLRLLMHSAGVDVSRFPGSRPEHRRVLLLRHHGVTVVLDVGANHGQYGAELRRHGYAGDIVSFEPLSEPWTSLEARANSDRQWRALRYAIGAEDGDVTINVAANMGASSSVLPMLDSHLSAAPGARYVGAERVQQRRLDDLVPELVRSDDRVFLKIDVQGYERSVLEGAQRTLDTVVGVQLELSLVPLYEGGIDWRAAVDLLASKGFVLESLEPGFSNPKTGQLLQADGIFFRG